MFGFKKKPNIWHDKSVLTLDVLEERLEKVAKVMDTQAPPLGRFAQVEIDKLKDICDPTGHRFSVHEYNLIGFDLYNKLKKRPDLSIIHAGVVRAWPHGPLPVERATTVCVGAVIRAMSTDRDGWDKIKMDAYNGILTFDDDVVYNKYLRIETELDILLRPILDGM